MIEYLELIANKSSTVEEAINLIKEDVDYSIIPNGYAGMKLTGIRDKAVSLEHKELGFKVTYPINISTLTAKDQCDSLFDLYLNSIYEY